MARISWSLSGIERSLVGRIAQANAEIALSTLRKASGHRIQASSDDPAAFMRLSGLQHDLTAVRGAAANAQAAATVLGGTQAALGGIGDQLNVIRAELLKDADHSLTADQRAESQAKIDAAIASIANLSAAESGGRRTLDGSADYRYRGQHTAQVTSVAVSSVAGSGRTIAGEVLAAATRAALRYTGNASNQITSTASLTLTGNRGETALNVTAGETLSAVAARINDDSYETGVTASVDTLAHTLLFNTVDYGSNASIAIAVGSGTFAVAGGNGDGTANGTNAAAKINGVTYAADSPNADGNRITVNDGGFRFSVEFAAGFSGALSTIAVEGQALSFRLLQDTQRASSIALPGVQPQRLGGASGRLDQLASGGILAGLGDNTAQAIRVVDEALGQVTRLGGRVNGFVDASITTASSLMSTLETKLTNAIDAVDKTDDDEEETRISHYKALASNAAAGLAILNEQRMTIVDLIRQLAGLA